MTTYAYNSAGDLYTISYSDTTPGVTLLYDRSGRPKSITDASGARTLTYHVSGQLGTETYTSGLLNGLSVTRDFDSYYRFHGVTSSNGSTILAPTYLYDEGSRLQTVTSGSNTATYAYQTNSNLIYTAPPLGPGKREAFVQGP